MATLSIHSTEFDAMIDVECDREGVMEAAYSETGECLSQAEFMRLERNSEDQREIANEFAAYRFYGDN